MTPAITSVAELGRYLRHYRAQHGYTQKDLNDQFKLRQGTISAIENGTPGVTLETLFYLITALNLALYLDQRPAPLPLDNEEVWS